MNVLVTSANGIEKFELIDGLVQMENVTKVIAGDAADSRHMGVSAVYTPCLEFVITPKFRSPEYFAFMNKICEEYNVDYYLSIDSYESVELSKMQRDPLMEIKYPLLYKVKGSWSSNLDENILSKIYVEEKLTSVFGDIRNFKVRSFKLPDGLEMCENFMNDLFVKFNGVVVKPIDSNGSRGLKIFTKDWYESNNLESRSPYVSPKETVFAYLKGYKGDVIVQPFFSGVTYNIDCFVSSSGKVNSVIQKVVGERWGQVQGSEIIIEGDEHWKEINNWTSVLMKIFEFDHNFNFELALSPELGTLELVEINPRVSAVIPQTLFTDFDLVKCMLTDSDTVDSLNVKLYKKSVFRTLITK